MKDCNCHCCQLSHRIQSFLKSLPDDLRDEGTKLIGDMWAEMEDDSTNLGVLRSKVAGVWPREDGENYYERIDGELFEVHGIKVNENAKKEENRG